MNYREIKQIDNVSRKFWFNSKFFAYVKKTPIKRSIIKSEDNSVVEIEVDNGVMDFYYAEVNNSYLLITDTGDGYFLSHDFDEIRKINDLKVSCTQPPEENLIVYKGGLFDKKYGLYSIRYQKLLFEIDEIIGHFLVNGKIIGESNNHITCRDIKDGDIIWSVDAEKYGYNMVNGEERIMSLTKIIGVQDNILYVFLGNRLILGFDLNSGEQIYICEYKDNFLVLENLQLDAENKKIFSIGPNHYIEFNLLTSSYQIFDLTDTTKKNNVEMNRLGSWENNLVSFWQGYSSNRFGIFDREKKEIICSDEIKNIKNDLPSILEVKSQGDKLLVLDNANTLHLFKKL